MRPWISIAILVALPVSGSAHAPAPTVNLSKPAPGDDNMTPYRKLAEDTLTAFKAHDLPMAKKKAKELETAWDRNEKALQKSAPEVWNQIDKAMDDFIKPLSDKVPDAAKVQTTYDAFIEKLKLAVKK